MTKYYVLNNSIYCEVEGIQDKSWIHIVSPTLEDIDTVSSLTEIDKIFFTEDSFQKEIKAKTSAVVTFFNINNVQYRLILTNQYVITVCPNLQEEENGAKSVLCQLIKVIITEGLQSGMLDFKDMCYVLRASKNMRIITCGGTGENKFGYTLETILNSLENKKLLSETKGVYLSLHFSSNTKRECVDEFIKTISESINTSAAFIWSASLDESIEDEIKVLLIVAE